MATEFKPDPRFYDPQILDPEIVAQFEAVVFTNALVLTHRGDQCQEPCPIHAPSDHHMRTMFAQWRRDRNMVERICGHGVGHPDPDQMAYWQQTLSPAEATAQTIHGCCEDRCCIPVAPQEREKGV